MEMNRREAIAAGIFGFLGGIIGFNPKAKVLAVEEISAISSQIPEIIEKLPENFLPAETLAKAIGEENSISKIKFISLPKDGSITVRILPPAKGKHVFEMARSHNLLRDGYGKKVNCLKDLKNGLIRGSCPICDYYMNLWKESESSREKDRIQTQARLIKPVERFYYNAVMAGETVPQVLAVGKSIHHKIVENIIGNEFEKIESLGDVTNFQTGRDLEIAGEMKSIGNMSMPSYTIKFLEPSVQPEVNELNDLSVFSAKLPEKDVRESLDAYLAIM